MDNTQTTDVEFIDEEIYDPTPVTSASNDTGDSRTDSNESSDSNEPTNKQTQAETGESADKQADNAPTTKSDLKQQPVNKPKADRFESRIQKFERIRDEIKAENDRRERLGNQPNQPQPNGQAKTQVEPEFIPKPTPPKYSKEDLTKWYQAAQEKGDEASAKACLEGFREWEKHDQDLRFWKIENGQTFKEFEKTWNDNWTKATTKFPELKDKASELYKTADSMARKYPEILNRKTGDGQYVIAQVAAMKVKIKSHDSVVGALKDELAKTKEQLASYQKRAQPASQGNKPNLSKPGEGGTAEEKLAAKLGIA